MMAKDQLARGARSAKYFNSGKIGEDIEVKNLMSDAERIKLDKETAKLKKIEPKAKKDKRRVVPKGLQILVQRREPENLYAGILELPEGSKERPAEGTVIEVSKNVTEVKKGDVVLFGIYAGTEYPWGAETLLFITESEVIAVVE
jgi:co-chaperonin GroES (HSP10)